MSQEVSNSSPTDQVLITTNNSCSAAIPCSPQTNTTAFTSTKKDTIRTNTHQYHKDTQMKILLFAITLIFTLLRPSDAFTHPYHNINSFTTTQSQSQQQQYTPTTNRNLIITSAATLDGSPSSYEMSDFAKRMKNIIRKEEKQRNTKKRTTKSNNAAPKNLLRIKTLSDFKKVVGDEKERLVVVRWYAPWCKACKAIAPSFYRLAFQYPDVIFVDVPVTPENANLHQGLAVPSLPYGHIYHPTGKLVEELKISKKHFSNFATVLKTYVEQECSIEYDENAVMMKPKYGLPEENSRRRISTIQ